MAKCLLVLRRDGEGPACGRKEGCWCLSLSSWGPGRSGALGVLPTCANGRRGSPSGLTAKQGNHQSPGS